MISEDSRRLRMNVLFSLLYQLTIVVSGFILPRLILQYYGSEVNGLVSSITQFLSIISLAQMGVGAVVQAAFYKPIADRDSKKINQIFTSSSRFFNTIAILLLIYVFSLIFLYPKLNNVHYDFYFTTMLIIAISINAYSQYYIGITYRILLNALQYMYIQSAIGIVTTILNVISSVVLMKLGYSIASVKLVGSIIFLMQPLVIECIVKRKIAINSHETYEKEPIEQKWNGLAQHVAFIIFENTDVIVLTLFSNYKSISIYSVYNLVTNGLRLAINSMTDGVKSLLGKLYAEKKQNALQELFGYYEWIMHVSSTVVFSLCAVLIVPFALVYTKGIVDANYSQPLFGVILSLGVMFFCIRLPYLGMVTSAGMFKETQNSAIIEAVINIVLSLSFVYLWGVVGVAVGTLVGILYRLIYFVLFLKNKILYRSPLIFARLVIADLFVFIMTLVISKFFKLSSLNYISWIILSIKDASIVLSITCIMNVLFYRENCVLLIKKIFGRGNV